MRLMCILAATVLIAASLPAEELLIESFDYPNVYAARAAWLPYEDTPPVSLVERDDGTALRIDCPFTRDMERAACDLDLDIDLSRHGRFTLEFYVEDTKPLRNFSLYFRSPGGWYGAGFHAERGWNEITLLKSDFGSEDSPAGWSRITGIRLSQWKGDEGDTYIAIDNLKAYSADIAVVLSTKAIEAIAGEARSIESFAKDMQRLLAGSGITSDLLSDEDIIDGALEGRKVAVFAYPASLDPDVLEQARAFVDSGGKVFVFYSLDEGMAELLGIRTVGWRKTDETSPFATVAFDAGEIQGLPEQVRQDSWNANVVEPARDDARVIGWWQNAAGERSAEAAMILSDSGVYLGHVLTPADLAGKQRMMTALLGLFVPDVWERKAEHSLANAPRVGPYTSLDELRAHVAAQGSKPKAQALLDAGDAALDTAQRAVDEGKYAKACEDADRAHEAFREAYILSHAGRRGEFRALWEHSGAGAYPEKGWGASLGIIKKAGFNAIVPNMWWAGLAHYDSEYLPHSSTFEEHGDQIEQCVAEAHKRGIEVHAWKVNWNLTTAPKDFIEDLRADERTMVTVNGDPVDWLCPSHPDNYQLELDTMLEVARKYDVDGVHFDYIRYRDESVCYCDGCRERFQRDAGLTVENWPMDCYSGPLRDQYRDWRCEQITRLVRSTSEEARKLKPHIKISAAVFSNYPQTRTSIGQDWLLWVKEGYLDFVCPMDYTANNSSFRRMVSRQVAQVAGMAPLYPGIGASAPGIPADQVIAQVDIARELGADGFTVFQLSRTTATDHVPATGRGLLNPKTFTPNIAPKVTFDVPGDPDGGDGAVHLPKDQDLTVTLRLDGFGNHRQDVKGLTGTVELQTTSGATVESLAKLPTRPGAEVEVTVTPRDERLRLAAVGQLRFADGKKRRFVVRSVPFVFDAE